jgi:hypothetical protein
VEIALQQRPRWVEVVAVLAACAVAFAVIVKLDRDAADRAIARAEAATAAQAPARTRQSAAAAAAASRPRQTVPRTESIGGRGPISIPLGGAWSAGTTTAVAHQTPHMTRGATPDAALRRIVGPDTATDVLPAPRTDASSQRRRPTPAATLGPPRVFVEAAAARGTSEPARDGLPLGSALLVALAVCGAAMAGAGAVLVARPVARA